MEYRVKIIIATSLASLSIVFGAFGAHYLNGMIEPKMMDVYKTAVHYHQFGSLALFIFLLLGNKDQSGDIGFMLFLFGLLLFSGSLYLLSTAAILGIDTWRSFLGPLTPIGGFLMILAWLFLLKRSDLRN